MRFRTRSNPLELDLHPSSRELLLQQRNRLRAGSHPHRLRYGSRHLTHTGCVMEVGIFSKEDGKTLFITDFAYKGNTPNVIFNIVCNGIDSAPLRSAVTCTALTGQQPKNGNITFTTIDTTTRSIAWLASTGTPGDVKWTPTSNVIFTLGFRYVLPAEFVDFLDLSYQFEIEGSVHEDPQTVRILNKPPPAPLLNPTPSSRIMCNTWDNGAAFLCNVEMRDDIGPVRVVEKTPWDKFNFLITTEGCSSTGMKIAGFKAGVASNFDFEVRRLTPCAVVDINVTISAKIEGKVLSRLLENGSYAHTPFEFSGEAVTPTAVPTTAPTPAPHHKSGELKDIEIVLAVLGSGVFIATIIYCIRVHRQKTDEKQRAESWAPILNESESPSPTAGRVDRGASVVSRGRAQSTLEEIECGGPAAELENKDAFVATADELAE
eukprot:TRINITY_DN4033_c0_g1_i3.p1 TRINITY_DN4033_c0_g1~~TRINITY_DN4033_c0_g1_i3.p1  ORF type:complete len:433 (+),score=50.07 TRINITY_DN4033_c0_g1_i3:399-1697(+)